MNVMPSSIARFFRTKPAAEVTGAIATTPARASRVGVANSMQGHASVQRLAVVRPLEQSQTHISVTTLQKWAKPNGTANDVSSGAQKQRQTIVNALLEKQHNGSVSVPALKQTGDEVLKQLAADIKTSIKKGEGRTPTFVAAAYGHADCLAILVNAGADLNLGQNEGATPTYVAAFHGHADCLSILINACADLDQAQNEGATPAYVAAFHGHADCLSILINACADLDQAQNEGATPALVAACNGRTDCLKLLHRAGVDLSLATPLGTPLSVAEKMGHTETASALRALLLGDAAQPPQPVAAHSASFSAEQTPAPATVQNPVPTLSRQDSGLFQADGNDNLLAASIKANHQEVFECELPKTIQADALNNEVQRSVNKHFHSTALDIAAHYGRLDMAKAIQKAGGRSLRHGDPVLALRIAGLNVGKYDDFGNKIEA